MSLCQSCRDDVQTSVLQLRQIANALICRVCDHYMNGAIAMIFSCINVISSDALEHDPSIIHVAKSHGVCMHDIIEVR